MDYGAAKSFFASYMTTTRAPTYFYGDYFLNADEARKEADTFTNKSDFTETISHIPESLLDLVNSIPHMPIKWIKYVKVCLRF